MLKKKSSPLPPDYCCMILTTSFLITVWPYPDLSIHDLFVLNTRTRFLERLLRNQKEQSFFNTAQVLLHTSSFLCTTPNPYYTLSRFSLRLPSHHHLTEFRTGFTRLQSSKLISIESLTTSEDLPYIYPYIP